MKIRLLSGVAEVEAEAWDRLVGPDDSPFNEHAFLAACELDSAVPARGAQAQHVTLWDEERLVAALPLYLKGDGRGEFIYDYHWYEFAARHGLPYYPKALGMSPYTPVAGQRALIAPDVDAVEVRATLTDVACAVAHELGLSGVHLLFCAEAEADALQAQGWLRRLTFQPRWRNEGYADFDAFLARFRNKHRSQIKRERRRLQQHEVEVVTLRGDEIQPADWDAMQRFYLRTCALYGTRSNYLKPATWAALFATWRARLVLFQARRGSEVVASSLCVHKGAALYGRYWGCAEDLDALYFNLAFYAPIEEAIRQGWQEVYAGFGNAKTKYARGLEPCPTHSVHRLFDPTLHASIGAHLEQDREDTQGEIARVSASSRLKPS